MGAVEANKLAIWRLISDGFNAGRLEVADELCHPAFINHASIYAVPMGPEGLRDHIVAARASIEDFTLRIVALVGEGDDVAVLWQTHGRAGGYFRDGATGPPASAWLIGLYRFASGLVERWDANWEPLRLLAQAGAIDTVGATSGDIPRRGLRLDTIDWLHEPRSATYKTYVDEGEALPHRPRDATDRIQIAELCKRVLDAEFGLGPTDDNNTIAPGAYLSFADFPDQSGPTGMATRRAAFLAAFRTVALVVDRTIVDGQRVALHWRSTFLHHGDYLGLPATGRQVELAGSCLLQHDDGAVTEWIEILDWLTLLRQIGGLSSAFPACYPAQ